MMNSGNSRGPGVISRRDAGGLPLREGGIHRRPEQRGSAPAWQARPDSARMKQCSKTGGAAGNFSPVTLFSTIRRSLAAAALAGVHLAGADDLAARVVILANSRNPESVRLAEFYAGARGVPPANIVALPLPEGETVTWRDFIDQMYQPLQDELYRRGWIEGTASNLLDRWGRRRYAPGGHHISYLVVCRGVPLYIANDPAWLAENPTGKISPQFNRNDAAVDSELSLLAQRGYEITGFLSNPLFQNEHPGELEAEAVVKVSRLDGPTFESARQLVTSALEGERRGVLGRYYIDLRGPHPDGDRWLESAGRQLAGLGFDGDVENTGATFDGAARFDAPVFYFRLVCDECGRALCRARIRVSGRGGGVAHP